MSRMAAIMKAPFAVLFLYISLNIILNFRDPYFGLISNADLVPYGSLMMLLFNLTVMMLGALVIYSIYQDFTEPNQPQQFR